jgi:hypothetical protein
MVDGDGSPPREHGGLYHARNAGSTFRTCRDVRLESSAFGGKAEVRLRGRQGSFDPQRKSRLLTHRDAGVCHFLAHHPLKQC